MQTDNIIVALDSTDVKENYKLMDTLEGVAARVKIGSVLFSSEGPKVLDYARQKGFKIFLDLKFYDIPNTVSKAVYAVCNQHPVELLTLHASGGQEMIEATTKVVKDLPKAQQPKIICVTILTSFDQAQIVSAGYINQSIQEHALSLGNLSKNAGADGLVCSPLEVQNLSDQFGKDMIYVVPGIRLPSDQHGDQKRVATPKEAFDHGATFLVMGRSITQAQDPVAVFRSMQGM